MIAQETNRRLTTAGRLYVMHPEFTLRVVFCLAQRNKVSGCFVPVARHSD
jgi:hypothetical protein